MIVALTILAGAAAPAGGRTIDLRVTMTRTNCRAAPGIVQSGDATFRIVNRAKRPRFFTIAGRRSRYLRPGRTGTLRARLRRAGLYRYFCISRGRIRNPRTGVLAVRTDAPSREPPQHRIAVRPVAGGALELYDRRTGETFRPRGANYVRLAEQGGTGLHHSTFNVGLYDGPRADEALKRMRAGGSNVVRVFLSGACADRCVGHRLRGISSRYVAEVADFLRLARANGLYVIVTIDGLPTQTRYEATLNAEPRTLVEGANLDFLTAGGVQASASFWADFAAELIRQRAATDVVLAYELRNEVHFDGWAKPFTLTSGLVPTANGRTYDMAGQAQKDAMLDDGLAYWIERVRAAIRAVDPTALVAVGFFEPQQPNPSRGGDQRLIRTRAAIRGSSADLVDLHVSPGAELTLPHYMENFGVDGSEAKPILLGELGASRSAYPSLDETPYALQDWQRESCRFGVDGWLVRTWNTEEDAARWNALSGDGTIERALAPLNRPDPCAAAAGLHDVALGRPATASGSEAAKPPANAFDGNRQTAWSAGALAPQWVEVDLGSSQAVKRIRLHVSQFSAGFTLHRVYGRNSAESERLLHEFAGFTQGGDVLERTPPAPWPDVRYVRVETLASPSLVGWREVEVVSNG
jgi:F5/8 type C domain/Cellulase (glycosyl hydrolase family 5)